ncbi:MAG: family N-acetyltransferase [Paenibacillus sp.]|nr:family N-acetyltransferase [Paenibacillus sp.]
MAQIRRVRPHEFESAAKLADSVFRDAEQKSMRAAYPNSFSPSLSQSYGAFVDDNIVSYVGFVPSIIKIGEARLNVYSVGGVCTHPDQRGKGFAGAILEQLREHSVRAGAPLILVSGNRPLYERFGCRLFGETTTFELSMATASSIIEKQELHDTALRPISHTDWFGMKRLAELRAVAYEQSLWDLANLIEAAPTTSNSKQIHRVWVAERHGIVAAYAILAVPDGRRTPKKTPFLVEWAGDPDLAAALAARGMMDADVSSLRCVVPSHEVRFTEVLTEAGCTGEPTKQGGTVVVVDAERLLTQLAPFLTRINAAAFSKLRFRNQGHDTYIVEWDGISYELSASAIISLLFDRDGVQSALGDASHPAAALFPVPFPYTSGLNFA